MMLKDFEYYEDIFLMPEEVVKKAKTIPLFSNEPVHLQGSLNALDSFAEEQKPPGGWAGYRTPKLSVHYRNIHDILMEQIFRRLFPFACSLEAECHSFFHFSTKNIQRKIEEHWHVDDRDVRQFLAGVVYLNADVDNLAGTILKIDDDEVVLKNKFNCLSVYRTNILHRPGELFGDNIDNSRLTFTFFIQSIKIN